MSKGYKPFSEREGHTKPKTIQRERMDDRLRNRLWNEFYKLFNHLNWTSQTGQRILLDIWVYFIVKPQDEFDISDTKSIVKEFFLKENWARVYDLVEFVVGILHDRHIPILRDQFIAHCNISLKRENSAYTIINGQVAPITDEQEIGSIEDAYNAPYESVRKHIDKSLSLLADRNRPDYKGSIREAIHAIESLAKEVTGKDNGTLGRLVQKLPLQHSQFRESLKNLYNFTSDAGGIRHGEKPNENLPIDQNTARFMLVTCSAFVNYIISQYPELENNEPKRD